MGFSWWRGSNDRPTDDDRYQRQVEALREQVPVPALWLFGKTGSGKSSVIRYLTGAEEAAIGEGCRPETKTSHRFDFPDASDPLLTFLDTRGLAEATYDPTEDIERFSEATQLMIVTVRVTDHALLSIIEPLRRIRSSMPGRPVLLVLTCLHEAMGMDDISEDLDPFASSPWAISDTLRTLIDKKISQFSGLHDDVIPIDLTKPEDGFADSNFGGPRLKQTILDHLPQAYRQALLALTESVGTAQTARHKKTRWLILASSAMAGTAGAVPIPWVDIPAVLGIQTHLAMQIAKIYDQEITPARWAVLSSAAGSRIALRLAIREALKFIPMVGMAASAASSFAYTYALGMSWDWYFADLRKGNVPNPDQLKEIFAAQLKRGHELWRAQ